MLCILCCNLPKQNLLLQAWQRRIVDIEPHRHRLPLILQLDMVRVEGEVEDAGGRGRQRAEGEGVGRAGSLRLRAGGCGAVDGGHAQTHLGVRPDLSVCCISGA